MLDPHDAADITQATIAVATTRSGFCEEPRATRRRSIVERSKRFVGISPGVAGLISYFTGFKFGRASYYHRWNQYHYYMEAK